MIIVKTPMRVSLFGGGTDDPAYFKEHGGAVLGMAIDKYCWVTLRRLPPFFEHSHRLVYSIIETVKDARDLKHPMVRTALMSTSLKHGLEVHHDADLPARSGMGSSSSFTVGFLQAIAALRGALMSKKDLADAAIHLERDLIPEAGGWQDQIFGSYGGLNRIDFDANGYSVAPMILPRDRLNELTSSLVLYFTGFSRNASEIELGKRERVSVNSERLKLMTDMVDEAEAILISPTWTLRELGHLLNEGWKFKRDLSPEVSTPDIDAMHEAGLKVGAWGGKLLGAGSGGFLLFLCPHERKMALRMAMRDRIEINFDVDYDGSRIVFYQPNGL